MFTICVFFASSGQPAKGARVTVHNTAFLGWGPHQETADDNGEVDFDLAPTNRGIVTVDPGFFYKTVGRAYDGPLRGRISVYI